MDTKKNSKKIRQMDTNIVNIFTSHYLGGDDIGWGSKLSFHKTYVEWLKHFLLGNSIKKVVDIGCGDWKFSKIMYPMLHNIEYVGIDCVSPVIEANKIAYPGYTFIHDEVTTNVDNIPNSDIYIIKDVLQHWCEKRIFRFLNRLIKSKHFRYIIICNCKSQHRVDIKDGEWRPLSLHHYPLSYFNPISVLQYHSKEVCIIQNPGKA